MGTIDHRIKDSKDLRQSQESSNGTGPATSMNRKKSLEHNLMHHWQSQPLRNISFTTTEDADQTE